MNQIVKDIILKDTCSLFNKDVTNVTFQNCSFDHLVLSDIRFENVDFINCKFDHVFVEWFCAKDILMANCEILSLSLRGDRKITSRKLFQTIKERKIEALRFTETRIDELILGGNLQVISCAFPEGENYLHIKNPFLIYGKCVEHIDKNWKGERRTIALNVIKTLYLDKQVENQNEDFIGHSYDTYLDKEINDIMQSVFELIKETAESVNAVK